MTVTPTPPNDGQQGNQPAQNGRVIRLTPFNLILAIGLIAGLVMSAIAIYVGVQKPAPNNNLSNEQSRMYDLGTQWAQGYVEALKVGNPDQNVLNSLYGACIVYTDSRIVPQYGQTLAPSWLQGCLDYTREQQTTITTTSALPTKTTN